MSVRKAGMTGYFRASRLLIAAGFVEEGLAGHESCLGAVVDSVGSLLFFIAVTPERSGAMHAVFVERIEVNMEGAEFFLVVSVVVRDAAQRFHARIRR